MNLTSVVSTYLLHYKPLPIVLKILFKFSHGQAAVKQSFSLNKNLIAKNMKSKTLSARQITIYPM